MVMLPRRRRRDLRATHLPLLAGLVALLPACAPVLGPGVGGGARDAYLRSLDATGLAGSGLVERWLAEGERALQQAPHVPARFDETIQLGIDAPSAAGYRLALAKGDRLRVSVDGGDAGRVFLELFQLGAGESGEPQRVAVAGAGDNALDVRAPRTGAYVVRVQSRLMHGGRFRVRFGAAPFAAGAGRGRGATPPAGPDAATLEFPVAGGSTRDIRSGFGDPRDGGARQHRGVDIFAPRGTLALAAADGRVQQATTTSIGGRVVWLECERCDLVFYYAHLDEHLVRAGQRVRAGEPVGRVGNTGNARTTPPHLHFGVYRHRVALDPYPFLGETVRYARRSAPVASFDVGSLGLWARAGEEGFLLREAPDSRSAVRQHLPPLTPARLVGATEAWYRAELPDGTGGFLLRHGVTPLRQPLGLERLERPGAILAAPEAGAAVLETRDSGAVVEVLARFGDYLLVRAAGGASGWLAP
jgi:peptidoglycan LD-endopeptidase LytH